MVVVVNEHLTKSRYYFMKEYLLWTVDNKIIFTHTKEYLDLHGKYIVA